MLPVSPTTVRLVSMPLAPDRKATTFGRARRACMYWDSPIHTSLTRSQSGSTIMVTMNSRILIGMIRSWLHVKRTTPGATWP